MMRYHIRLQQNFFMFRLFPNVFSFKKKLFLFENARANRYRFSYKAIECLYSSRSFRFQNKFQNKNVFKHLCLSTENKKHKTGQQERGSR